MTTTGLARLSLPLKRHVVSIRLRFLVRNVLLLLLLGLSAYRAPASAREVSEAITVIRFLGWRVDLCESSRFLNWVWKNQ